MEPNLLVLVRSYLEVMPNLGPSSARYDFLKSSIPTDKAFSHSNAGSVHRKESSILHGREAQDFTCSGSSSDTGGSCIWSPSIATGTPLENRDSAWTNPQ